MKSGFLVLLSVLCILFLAACPVSATNWYVSPTGVSSNAGTLASPWDLGTALSGHSNQVQPGDNLYLMDGNYPESFTTSTYNGNPYVFLVGTPKARITVQPAPGAAHVRICGFAAGDVENYGSGNVYTWCKNVDFLNLELASSRWFGSVSSAQTGPWASDIPHPLAGAKFFCGVGNRLINCIIHASDEGIDSWAEDQELIAYGNSVYGCGWQGADHGWGHCVYTQNGDPNGKFYTNNIFTNRYTPGQLTLQAYGSGEANIAHFWIQKNIAHDGGEFLVGGGAAGDDEHMLNNVCYRADFWAGYSLGSWQNLHYEVKNNYVVDATLNYFSIQYLDANNNTAVGSGQTRMWPYPQSGTIYYNGTPASPTPGSPTVFLFPNTYQAGRGHLAVFNWNYSSSPNVQVNLAGVVGANGQFKLMDPCNFYGTPVYQGSTDAGDVATIPVNARFGVYIVLATDPNQNMAPLVNAGADQIVRLPATSTTLAGSASDDAKINPLVYTWTQLSGPSAAIVSPSSLTTTINLTGGLGTYVFHLDANDGQLNAGDDVQVMLLDNQAPVVNAGANQTITSPANTVSLSGSISDDGLPVGGTLTYTWSKTSGPGTVTFGTDSASHDGHILHVRHLYPAFDG